MKSQVLLNKINKVIASKHSNIHKLIQIQELIKEHFIIDKNEDVPELIDPQKKPLIITSVSKYK